ncbi:MAG: hypothetical protein M3Q27_03715 [Actinomycetota bacterium]|nr:hypothetical protein [Actinomycetota bacterium]
MNPWIKRAVVAFVVPRVMAKAKQMMDDRQAAAAPPPRRRGFPGRSVPTGGSYGRSYERSTSTGGSARRGGGIRFR